MKQMLRRRRYGNTLNYYNNHNIRLLQKYSSTLEKEEYTRVDPVEHVLLRPGMYVGATQRSSRVMWLANQKMDFQLNILQITTCAISLALVLRDDLIFYHV